MSKIEFYHNQSAGTFALELLEGHDLEAFIDQWLKAPRKNKPTRIFNFGASRLHPTDRFCKKTGREISVANMNAIDFELIHMETINDQLSISFRNKEFIFTTVYTSYTQPAILVWAGNV